ncbi:TPA: CCA tRNA nucleotidyltransferase [bacterium]|nr:CCA tRNA nucleotidyltransferase [bacterium]
MTQNKKINFESLILNKLPPKIYKLLKSIGIESKKLGYSAYVVGGFVRDLILGRPNLDIDIIIEGDGIDFAMKFAEINKGKAKSHKRFGTSVVTMKDGFKIDIVTARTEIYEHPGALPTVKFGSIKDDLYRRDFTINAMAINLDNGDLVDFLDGMSDLKNEKIKIIHDRSFLDDPTRIFRAIRFEQRFSFNIDKQTEKLLKEAIEKDFLNTITRQRIRNEILLILDEENSTEPLRRMEKLNLIRYIHPEISLTKEKLSILNKIDGLKMFENLPFLRSSEKFDYVLLRLMALVDGLNETDFTDAIDGLFLNKRYIDNLRASFFDLPIALQQINDDAVTLSGIYNSLKNLPLQALIFGIFKAMDEEAVYKLMMYLADLRKIKPFINGDDLKELGYPESPLYTDILSKVFDMQLDGIIENKEQAIKFIKQNYDK